MENTFQSFQPLRSQYRVRWTDGQSKEKNLLEISYEAFAAKTERRDVGTESISAIRIGDEAKSRIIDAVAIQRFPAAVDEHGMDLGRGGRESEESTGR